MTGPVRWAGANGGRAPHRRVPGCLPHGTATERQYRHRHLDPARPQLVRPDRDDLVLPGVLDARPALGRAQRLDLLGQVPPGCDEITQLSIDVIDELSSLVDRGDGRRGAGGIDDVFHKWAFRSEARRTPGRDNPEADRAWVWRLCRVRSAAERGPCPVPIKQPQRRAVTCESAARESTALHGKSMPAACRFVQAPDLLGSHPPRLLGNPTPTDPSP